MTALPVAAALAGALCIVLSTSFQHTSAEAAPGGASGSRRLLLHLAGRPVWLLGLLIGLAGFVLHALALAVGAVSLVQPLMVSVLVFALPVRAALDRRAPTVRSLAWAALTALALAAFIVVSHPSVESGAPQHADAGLLVLGGVVLAGGASWRASVELRAGRRVPAGLLLGAAGGVLFGLVAGVLKLTALALAAQGTAGLLSGWQLWVLLALSAWGFALNQRAYQAAPLAVSLPVLTMLELLAALAFGFYVFGEKPADQPVSVAIEGAALLLVALGVVQLCRRTGADHVDAPAVMGLGV